MIERCVITVAVGKDYYLNLAKNLIKSFLVWNTKGISFLLLTDNAKFFHEFSEAIVVKQLELSQNDKSFTSKFLMYEHAIADYNLFIDCDCLIYGSLLKAFERMGNLDFTAVGGELTTGEFFCNVKEILQRFNVTYLPHFVGSVYYFRKSKVAEEIFNRANKLKANYDEHGFIRLRGKENEEPLFGVAMALSNQHTIKDDGTIKVDIMEVGSYECNVIKGTNRLVKNDKTINGSLIIHFNDVFSEGAEYRAEIFRLNRLEKSYFITKIIIVFKFVLPAFILKKVKNLIRPIFHFVFRPFQISRSKRL